ncbi:MAG TPA: AI-2E family transporter [Candidatus Sulfotelmatobacter sp.]|nr:AI-2E family transporter [Candidatus Sulfotelmatobacter sp.]
MPLADGRTARVIITVLLFAVGLGFLYAARQTLVAFLFAIFFAYLMSPLVSYLEKPLHGRVFAIAVIYVFLISLVVLFFISTGPRIARESARLGQSLPALSRLSSGQIAQQIGQEHGWNSRLVELAQKYLYSHSNDIEKLAQAVGLWVADVAKEAWLLLIVPLLSIFFLKDGRAFSQILLDLVQSRPQRELLQGVLSDLNQMLAHFIRAQLSLAALTLVVYSAVLGIMRMPNALVLGTLGGMLEFIPVVGPLVAVIVIVSIALLMSYPHWLALIIFLGAWRLIQDYVNSPRILGRSMELHPLAAIFGVMAGGEVAGILGIFLSIPVMASLRIVFRRWRLYAEKRKFGPLDEYAIGGKIGAKK